MVGEDKAKECSVFLTGAACFAAAVLLLKIWRWPAPVRTACRIPVSM